MNLANRVAKLEVKNTKATAPKWLFVSNDRFLGSVQDINHIYDTSIQNKERIPTDEFLDLATAHFGIDMKEIYYSDNEEFQVV